jgi:hypothetical protein
MSALLARRCLHFALCFISIAIPLHLAHVTFQHLFIHIQTNVPYGRRVKQNTAPAHFTAFLFVLKDYIPYSCLDDGLVHSLGWI